MFKQESVHKQTDRWTDATKHIISPALWSITFCIYALQECRRRRQMIIICVFSPKVDIENIEKLELRETIRSVTYLRWPKRISNSGENFHRRMELQHFWRRLHRDIMTGSEDTSISPVAHLSL